MDDTRGGSAVILAGAFLMLGGVLNVIYGIAAISNSKFFVNETKFIFSDLKTWGWILLIIGILELFASASLLAGKAFGRWVGIVVGSLAAISALLSISAYPLWSLAIFALSLWIVYGLSVYWVPGGR
ncbi:MAG TPA: hypothetical protein VFI54_28515 [Solirubrobacteraceae bacterium]|nr:hypothetical protein [Solirubrobacteraceae bacterium]